jgi:hypothetical protein
VVRPEESSDLGRSITARPPKREYWAAERSGAPISGWRVFAAGERAQRLSAGEGSHRPFDMQVRCRDDTETASPADEQYSGLVSADH